MEARHKLTLVPSLACLIALVHHPVEGILGTSRVPLRTKKDLKCLEIYAT